MRHSDNPGARRIRRIHDTDKSDRGAILAVLRPITPQPVEAWNEQKTVE